MRLHEFTNAQEQLGLLRTIIDSTWTAIAQQAKAQAAQKSAVKYKPKAKQIAKVTPKVHTQNDIKSQLKVPVVQPTFPRQPLQQPPLSNTIKAARTTTNMSSQNNLQALPQISPAPK